MTIRANMSGTWFRSVSVVVLCCAASWGISAAEKVTVRVMTRNMDAGTDLKLVLAAHDDVSFAQGVDATLAEIKDSGIVQRAARVAEEIAQQKPDLVGLQEVTLYRTGPLSLQPSGAADVLFDQLDSLVAELANRNLKYAVVVTQNLLDVEVPVPTQNLNLRMTDRDVILVRSDLKQSDLDVFNIQTRRFQTLLPLPVLGGLVVLRSWESADVKMGGKVFRLVSTHLEGPIPGVPQTVLVQLAQAQEMLDALKTTDSPVVLLGDFNANAETGPDHTGAVELVLSAGFQDAWHALCPEDSGYTWPLFPEDQDRGHPITSQERIDLIFARGLTPVSIQRISLGGFWGKMASDHAGVIATLEIEN